ncbi:MAG: Metallo-beta-lactamase [candidate division CPR2 bacterium GW2011_GWC1_39_9]|uniref:Metallo-beta-lactamase domain-containing protein 1 n=1 Tax=candidate division CPR2 bacterium GW2011_GWC2_39_10 TaxID=1618345 RepID=A0A0G0M356_UNCC2|nr:MAG: Metallo-beta-lactamase [candidate division CPR2 bacterium GW2011_GWC2_39_10]KKR34124.1 MAG: Metallo-beta-lactamase [candidate division CPR2 bacterium GW2011_GWC1_39_9]
MAQVDILIKGYNQEVSEELHKYASTTTLVRSGEFNIVVDPGTHKSTDLYVQALRDFDLTPDDITQVFTTHEHLDHTRDIPFFKNATVIDGVGFHKADEHRFDESEELEIAPGVKRIATPGHGQEDQHASLLVETDGGVICIAGDVWWNEDFTPVEDPYASDQKALEESRKKILELADYIIPGHGGMVKVKK